jgi:hypothetical protein
MFPSANFHINSSLKTGATTWLQETAGATFNSLFAQAATISTTYKKGIANNWSGLLNNYIYASKPTILHL